jgi:branched-chain amino acid transport system substrate-binding protein
MRANKKLNALCVTLLGLLFAILSLMAVGYGSKKPETELIIGSVLPMTGDAGTFGQNAARGAELAIAEAMGKKLLGETRIKLLVEDSRGNPADAASAARKLTDVDGASLMIGDVTSAGTHAIVPIITKEHIPTISPAASDPALSGTSPFFARVWPSDVYEARVIGKYALAKGFSRIAVIYTNTDYGVGMVKAFRTVVPKGTIMLDIPVDRGLVDFRPTLKRIQLRGADALFAVEYPEDAKRLLGQMEEMHIELPVLGTATFEDPMVATSPGAKKVVFASPIPPDDKEALRAAFLKAYKEKYGSDPGVLSDTGYDSAAILIVAWATAGSQGPKAVAQYIRGLRNYPGVSGKMSFDDKGDVQKPYGLKTVREQSFVWLDQK